MPRLNERTARFVEVCPQLGSGKRSHLLNLGRSALCTTWILRGRSARAGSDQHSPLTTSVADEMRDYLAACPFRKKRSLVELVIAQVVDCGPDAVLSKTGGTDEVLDGLDRQFHDSIMSWQSCTPICRFALSTGVPVAVILCG